MSHPNRATADKVLSVLIDAAERLIDAWDEDEIGQIDGEHVDRLRDAVDQAKGMK